MITKKKDSHKNFLFQYLLNITGYIFIHFITFNVSVMILLYI